MRRVLASARTHTSVGREEAALRDLVAIDEQARRRDYSRPSKIHNWPHGHPPKLVVKGWA